MRHRFHALCPYFAMFPETFAEHWINKLTKPGDTVLDPFCGRGTLPFQALLMDRKSIGCDTNPVAFCISTAKTNPPSLGRALNRVDELATKFARSPSRARNEAEKLPNFFKRAYRRITLEQIVFLRRQLQHRTSTVDCMIAAVVLGSLHGETDRSSRFLSNQMPHTISTKPDYSVRFWQERGLKAPKRDAFQLLREQLYFRYESELPTHRGTIFNIDMRDLPRRLSKKAPPIRCAVTSPPYFDVTNYAEDQWLRLWFLGGPPYPTKHDFSKDDRHGRPDRYWSLLADMWRTLDLVLDKKADVIIRVGAKRISPKQLVNGLQGVAKVSDRRITLVDYEVSEIVKRQTDSFRPGSTGCKVEVDCHFKVA